jgi:hypothetical protein
MSNTTNKNRINKQKKAMAAISQANRNKLQMPYSALSTLPTVYRMPPLNIRLPPPVPPAVQVFRAPANIRPHDALRTNHTIWTRNLQQRHKNYPETPQRGRGKYSRQNKKRSNCTKRKNSRHRS